MTHIKSTNRNLTSVGIAVSLALAGASAHALPITSYNEADTTNQVTLYVSGATAQDPGLVKLEQLNEANNGLCTNGTLDLFVSADGLKRLAFCTGRAGLGAPLAGKRLAIHKASEGGSGNGVAPLVRAPGVLANPVDFWNVATGGGFLTACAGAVTVPGGAFASFTLHSACANTPIVNPAPQAGLSDLEPAIFRTAFSPSLSTTELNAIPPQGINATVFGIPVTLNVRNNLQTVQFGAGDPCVGSETEACAPSLTKSQLAALYSANYADWSFLTNGVADVATGLANNGEVFICRRVGTSGTQATFETQLLRQRCTDGVAPFLTAADDPAHVTEGSGSGNVVSCLTAAQAANRGAIGVLSMEFPPVIGAGDSGYRFIKIDGQPPCLLDIVKSEYDFVAESTMQWRTAAVGGLPALSGNPLTLAQAIRTRFGNTAAVNDLNTAFTHPICSGHGSGALLGNALTGTPAVPPFVVGGGGTGDVVARPVMTKTRGLTGPKACGALIDVHPTQPTIE